MASQRVAWTVSTSTRSPAIQSRPPSALSSRQRLLKLGDRLRLFHSTPHPNDSSFLNLSRLSLTQESRFLSKERGIPRTELAPHLELIRKSEVDPFIGRTTPLGLSPGDKDGYNANSLVKELERMKGERERSQAALRDLEERYKEKGSEATTLAFVTGGLTLGLLYSIDFRELCEPAVKRWRRANEKADALLARMTETSSNTPKDQSCSSSGTGVEQVDKKSTNGQVPAKRSNWTRLLWA